MVDRSQIQRGMRLTGAAYPVDDPRRDRIKKGVFLTGAPTARRPPLPPDLADFKEAAAFADRLADVPSLDDIRHKIAQATQKLEALRGVVRKR